MSWLNAHARFAWAGLPIALCSMSSMCSCTRNPKASDVQKVEPPQAQQPVEAGFDTARPHGPEADAGVASTDLRAAVERGDFTQALSLLRSQRDRAQPEWAYLEARLCYETQSFTEAQKLLEGLERRLPLLADSIHDLRARAALASGDAATALAFYGKRDDLRSQLRAAEAFAKQKDDAGVVRATSAVLLRKGLARADETLARTLRFSAQNETGTQDARWLYLHAPTSEGGKRARLRLGKDPDFASAEWQTYAHSLVDAGQLDDALAIASKLKGSTCPRGELLARARNYLEASKAYGVCVSQSPTRERGTLALESARALSRAHKDDEARAAFELVEKRFPEVAPKARFLRGRLYALAGKFTEAAAVLDLGSESEGGAERLRVRAIAHLLANDPKTARTLFTRLAGEGSEEERARASNLAGAAALALGEKLAAVGIWSSVARSRPLEYSGLVANAHLRSVGVETESLLGRPSAARSTPLPAFVETLRTLGLGDEAEAALRQREREVVEQSGGRATEALCNAYGMVDRAERRFELHTQIGRPLLEVLGPETTWAWRCAYPAPYAALIQSESARANIAPEWVYAVMRAESGFRPRVRSPALAVGLLQLMPKTAAEVAKRRKETLPENWADDAFTNIRLGTDYLGAMMADLGSPALGVAAYNAGPDAIRRWQSGMGKVPLDVFVELIPYEETRIYVSRVLSNYAHYAFLRSETLPTLELAVK